VARKFIVDGIEYPDPGSDVTPDQFKQMMASFLPELSNADMTTEKQGDDTIYRFRKRVGTKG
jgi:PRTRC genetic system protein C